MIFEEGNKMSNTHTYDDNYVENGVVTNPFLIRVSLQSMVYFQSACKKHLERKRIVFNKGSYEKHSYYSGI